METLAKKITEEMKTIRETELDRTGGFKGMYVYSDGQENPVWAKLFVDRIGRVIVPTGESHETITHVEFKGKKRRAVIKKEPRFEGQEEVALVLYLEAEEEDARVN